MDPKNPNFTASVEISAAALSLVCAQSALESGAVTTATSALLQSMRQITEALDALNRHGRGIPIRVSKDGDR